MNLVSVSVLARSCAVKRGAGSGPLDGGLRASDAHAKIIRKGESDARSAQHSARRPAQLQSAGVHGTRPCDTPAGVYAGLQDEVLRSPQKALWSLQNSLSEVTGPLFGHDELGPLDNDLILNYAKDGEPIGERIIVHWQLLDQNGRGIPKVLVEFWQANAGGRYRHRNDRYIAPIDPNFGGCGRPITDEKGYYYFRPIKPGPYPWRNYVNSWRPAHIHFSVCGSGFVQRLITQLYFEGDPLIPFDPIVGVIPDKEAIKSLIGALDLEAQVPLDTLAYRFNIVLRGTRSTLFENKLQGN